MTFTPQQFIAGGNFLHRHDWKKSNDEGVAIFVNAVPGEDFCKAVERINELVKIEPQVRSEAAQRIYPDESYWLDEDCDLKSPAELLSVLRWTIMDVRSDGNGIFQCRLVYVGPDDFQTLTAKHVMLIEVPDHGDWDVNFESYDEY